MLQGPQRTCFDFNLDPRATHARRPLEDHPQPETEMSTATLPFRFRRASSSSLVVFLSFAAAVGCGGSEVGGGDGADPAPSGGSASTANPTPNPTPSQGAASSNGEQTPAASPPSSNPTNPASNESNTTPASVDGANVGAACAELGTSDACGACVCSECGTELDTCANTPGCPEILACVRENGCSGTDCFCGDAALPRCFNGGGDGPCKDVVLAAPGGREPTLADPSGGPASDAALEVGECADDDDRCADVCDVGL